MKILMIDNYDSFTYNLVQYLGELGADVEVRRNDAITVDEIAERKPDGIVVSPGPCTPKEAGVSVAAIQRFKGVIPILGVCLGHQAIGAALGGDIVRAPRIMHGKTSPIRHDGRGVFRDLSDPFDATRYHSLVIDPATLPAELEVSAWTAEGEIMGVRHRELPLEGVQFHPESILTLEGKPLLRNFLESLSARRGARVVTSGPAASSAEAPARVLRHAIATVVAGRHLDEATMRAVVDAIMDGLATPAQIGSLLTGLRMKGETVDELVGTARSMRARMLTVPVTGPVVDTCGTGGDGADVFNVSTAVALTVAGAGAPVAKHGNRAQSGRVGGADVLEALGVRIDLAPAGVARCIERAGIGFCFAPRFHGAMRFAAGPRREIGLRTIFNFVGPLANPAGASAQLVGVSEAKWTEPMAEALRRLGVTRAMVVHGSEGLDEIGTAQSTRVSEVAATGVRTYELRPEDFELTPRTAPLPRVADAGESAAIIRAVLAGERGPARDLVLVNAAAALVLAGRAADWRAGMQLGSGALDGGGAARALARLVETSHDYEDPPES